MKKRTRHNIRRNTDPSVSGFFRALRGEREKVDEGPPPTRNEIIEFLVPAAIGGVLTGALGTAFKNYIDKNYPDWRTRFLDIAAFVPASFVVYGISRATAPKSWRQMMQGSILVSGIAGMSGIYQIMCKRQDGTVGPATKHSPCAASSGPANMQATSSPQMKGW